VGAVAVRFVAAVEVAVEVAVVPEVVVVGPVDGVVGTPELRSLPSGLMFCAARCLLRARAARAAGVSRRPAAPDMVYVEGSST
jgi:hypothetical protein